MIHLSPNQKASYDRKSFSPTRLTVARQLRGFTKKALAERSGVSAPAITQFETATNNPTLDTVHEMALALDFPFEFFFGPELDLIAEGALTFRSRRSMTASLRAKAAAASALVVDVISPAIRQKFRLPKVDVPDLSEHSPETAATLLRCHWQMGHGPIANTVHLLESRGVEVYWVREEASSLSAFSWWKNDQPFVMLNAASPSGDRGRFDAAHELAHLVLHRNEAELDSRKVESEADCFAAAFLLPADQFRRESPRLPMLGQFRALKKRWGVSIAAMVRRSRDIGIFTDWQYECACKDIATMGWRMSEPWHIEREQSQVHTVVFEKLLGKDITPERFARELCLPLQQLEILIPVATKFHEKNVYVDDEYSLNKLWQIDAERREADSSYD